MTTKLPPPSQQQPPVSDPPGGVPYEALLTAVGTLAEQKPGGVSETGEVKVIQGRVDENPEAGFFAFLSVATLNVPLVSTSRTSRVSPPPSPGGAAAYRVVIPDGSEFLLTLDPKTEPAIVEGTESLLQWFTTFEGSATPVGTTEAGSAQQGGVNGMIESAGAAGAAMITQLGGKLNASVKARADAAVAAQGDQPPKKVKLGGAVTATALGGAAKVASVGAGVATTVIDKISSAAGNAVANSSVVTNSRKAPEGSKRRVAHDFLVTGAMAAARVWEAADGQGRLLLESTGDGMGRVAGAKYGEEAENAARKAGNIGLDGWRIFRFPAKLGVSTVVKGAVKGAAAAKQEAAAAAAAAAAAGNPAQPDAAPAAVVATAVPAPHSS